jgi:uncharacterized MnhB-related membrane protein
MLYILLVLMMIVCAIQAIRTKQLLTSALWLAGVSALIALTLYSLGAAQVAVIELSVGAGLVTVLFVFAINIASDEDSDKKSVLPAWLTWALAGLAVLVLAWLALPLESLGVPVPELSFTSVLWEQRGLDVMVQIVLIFAAVLGLLNILSEIETVDETHAEAAIVKVEVKN